MNKAKFDKRMTNICKGIAVIVMVIHHIFPGVTGYGLKIGNIWVMPQIATLGKVCVSIFLLLSGYGLCESCRNRELKLKQFYLRRLKTIYSNYWLVFLIFTALGWFFFRDFFLNFIQQPFDPAVNLVINFFGVQYFIVGYMGFNPSWWFVTEILLLYLLFPAMYKLLGIKWGPCILAALGAACLVFKYILIGRLYIDLIYVAPFIIGMLFSKYDVIEMIGGWLGRRKWYLWLVLVFMCLVSFLRIRVGLETVGIWLDCILAPLFCCVIYYLCSPYPDSRALGVLQFLGVHSFNIYLIHLFITNMYTTPYIYGLNSPFFMVGAAVLVSLCFSLLIEKIKKILSAVGTACMKGMKKV